MPSDLILAAIGTIAIWLCYIPQMLSEREERHAAAIYSLTETCQLNEVDPHAWLTDILAKLPDHPAHRVGELLPWAWKARRAEALIAAAA